MSTEEVEKDLDFYIRRSVAILEYVGLPISTKFSKYYDHGEIDVAPVKIMLKDIIYYFDDELLNKIQV